jgi:hypothetical protein
MEMSMVGAVSRFPEQSIGRLHQNGMAIDKSARKRPMLCTRNGV